jgi:competence protein ComEA
MKVCHLLLVTLFACTLSLSPLSEATYAASAKNEVTSSTDTAKKQIPQEININTADQEMLTQLPGIGPVTAEKIVEYRKVNGKFESVDELTNVKGIGNKTLAKLKPYLYKI